MDHDTRRFVREAKRDIRRLIAECEAPPATEVECDEETEMIVRSSVGGSANLAFFIPYLWRHRH